MHRLCLDRASSRTTITTTCEALGEPALRVVHLLPLPGALGLCRANHAPGQVMTITRVIAQKHACLAFLLPLPRPTVCSMPHLRQLLKVPRCPLRKGGQTSGLSLWAACPPRYAGQAVAPHMGPLLWASGLVEQFKGALLGERVGGAGRQDPKVGPPLCL